ncbi:hypothetical protein C8R43DRAFT_1157429 [Mycena crocata]|nr:hypothetical protein C8R43DRAFT_1157429 [Mycena crocata]
MPRSLFADRPLRRSSQAVSAVSRSRARCSLTALSVDLHSRECRLTIACSTFADRPVRRSPQAAVSAVSRSRARRSLTALSVALCRNECHLAIARSTFADRPLPRSPQLNKAVATCTQLVQTEFLPTTNTLANPARDIQHAESIAALCICAEQTFTESSAKKLQFSPAFSVALSAYVKSPVRQAVEKEIGVWIQEGGAGEEDVVHSAETYVEHSDEEGDEDSLQYWARDGARRARLQSLADIIISHRLRMWFLPPLTVIA